MKELTENDPSTGTTIKWPGIPNADRVALIWIGDCTSCSMRSLSQEQIQNVTPSGTQVVLLVPKEDLNKSYPLLPKVVVSKEQRKLLNAVFAPRVYILDHGKLIQAQLRTKPALEVLRGRS